MTSVAKTRCAAFLAVFAVAASAVAADIYVDSANYGKSGLTGAEGNAFGTIQDAVSAASTTGMDTIHVAAGTYDQGSTLITGTRYARVDIDRRVKIVADEGKEKTFLVGSHEGNGIGGFYFRNGGAGSIIEGFTVLDCKVGASATPKYYGAAFGCDSGMHTDPTTNSYTAAYCTMSNNVAYRGGAMAGGLAVSCVIASNAVYTSSDVGPAAYKSSAYNCIVADNSGTIAFYGPGYLVNCTFANNYISRGFRSEDAAWAAAGYGRYWNTVGIASKDVQNDTVGIYTNCVVDGTSYSNISHGVTQLIHGGSSSSNYENTMMASALGDYRPVAGGILDGTGVREYLSLDFIPPEYQGRGFDGEHWTGNVPIGALLEPATPATAPLKIVNILKLDGAIPACNRSVMQFDSYPKQIYVEPADASKKATWLGIGYQVNPTTTYKGQHDGVWVTAPMRENDATGGLLATWVISERTASAANVFYVDDDADPAGADGSAEHPFTTIQDACNALTAKSYSLINVMPGTYRTGGGACSWGHNARVVLPASAYVLIRAVEGPENTIIEGQPDPDTGGAGPKAYRCISSPNNTTLGVSGFTLTKGYSGTTTESSGGAFRGGGDNQQCYDCVFTGNGDASMFGLAGGGAGGNNGWFIRCVFSNNVDAFRGTIINSRASSCLFTGNQPSEAVRANMGDSNGYSPIGTSCKVYSSTIYEPTDIAGQIICNNADCSLVNCVIGAGGKLSAPNPSQLACGNVAWGVTSFASSFSAQQALNIDPKIVKPSRGDFRLAESSPVFSTGRLHNVTDSTIPVSALNPTNFFRYTLGTLANTRSVFEDGSVLSGAISETRPVQALYVDGDNGSDSNGGYAEDDAKKTFAGAFDELYSGDRLVVLPGTYDEGTMGPQVGPVTGSVAPTIGARVVVPENFTLESRDGPEATVIVGADATDSEATGGRGADAVRCVFLESGAKIKGFTIRGGRTHSASENIDDTYGAGVLGRGRTQGTVENCILTDNCGGRGAAGAYVSFVNCIVTNNTGTSFASGGIFCNAYNTYFADCIGPRVMDYPNQIVNCTFGEGNVNTNGVATWRIYDMYGSNPKIINVLDYSIAPVGEQSFENAIVSPFDPVEVRGFVSHSDAHFTFDDGNSSGIQTNLTRSALSAFYGEVGKPLAAAAPTVDAAYDVSGYTQIGATDVTGGQRIYGGAMDIGAAEYDIRGDVARTLSRRGVAVNSATPGVTLGGGGVAFGEGDSIALVWAPREPGMDCTYVVQYDLPAGARLVITVNGEAHAITAAGAGELAFDSSLASNALRIECESGSATLTRLAYTSAGLQIIVL